MKRLLLFSLALSLVFVPVNVLADAKDDRIAELEAQVSDLESRVSFLEQIVAELQSRLSLNDSSLTRSLVASEDVTYILNVKSHKIHKIDGVDTDTIAEGNRMETNLSLDELRAQGYTTCGRCFS